MRTPESPDLFPKHDAARTAYDDNLVPSEPKNAQARLSVPTVCLTSYVIIRDISLPELAELLSKVSTDQDETDTEGTVMLGNPFSLEETVDDLTVGLEIEIDALASPTPEERKGIENLTRAAYPTPPDTPPAALLSAVMLGFESRKHRT